MLIHTISSSPHDGMKQDTFHSVKKSFRDTEKNCPNLRKEAGVSCSQASPARAKMGPQLSPVSMQREKQISQLSFHLCYSVQSFIHIFRNIYSKCKVKVFPRKVFQICSTVDFSHSRNFTGADSLLGKRFSSCGSVFR